MEGGAAAVRSQRRSVSCRLQAVTTSSSLNRTAQEDAGRTTLASAVPRTPLLPSTARHRSAILLSLAKTRTVKHLSLNPPRLPSPSPFLPTAPRSDFPPSTSPIALRRRRGIHQDTWHRRDWDLDLRGAAAAVQAAAASLDRGRRTLASSGRPGARAVLPASVEGRLSVTARLEAVVREAARLSSPPSITRRTVNSLEYTRAVVASTDAPRIDVPSTRPSTRPLPSLSPSFSPSDSTSQFLLCLLPFPSPLSMPVSAPHPKLSLSV